MELLIFGLFGILALAGAVGVILLRNPVHCAISLLLTLFSVAALFAVLWAEFLAVVQLLVYAGGIMVLFLFVIMLVDLEQRGLALEAGRIANKVGPLHRALWGVSAAALAGAIGLVLSNAAHLPTASPDAVQQALQGPFNADGRALGNIEWVGTLLYSAYLIPFELASITLLVAMIGAVVIARREA